MITRYPAGSAARVRRRYQLTASLRHPHLLSILDVLTLDPDTDPDTGTAADADADADADGGAVANSLAAADTADVALVTAAAAGGTLDDVIAGGALRSGQVVTLVAGVASALAECHRRGMVHGDIQPAAICFTGDGRPLVAGVGWIQSAIDTGAQWDALPAAASPEIARGANPTAADDVFALGSLTMHCLTGRAAWPADDMRDVVIQSRFGQWPAADASTPQPWRQLIDAMLAADPADRPTADDVLRRLRDCGVPEAIEIRDADSRGDRVADRHSGPDLDPDGQIDTQIDGQIDTRIGGVARSHRDRQPVLASRVDGWSTRTGRRDQRSGPAGTRRPGPTWRRYPAEASRALGGAVREHLPVIAAAAVMAGAAVALGVWWSRADLPSAADLTATVTTTVAPGPSPAAVEVDWTAVVRDLDARRATAFERNDPSLLESVYLVDSPALVADTRTMRELEGAGYHVAEPAHHIQSVERAAGGGDDAPVVTVVQSMPRYRVQDAAGRVVGETAGTPVGVTEIRLSRLGSGEFRIAAIGPPH